MVWASKDHLTGHPFPPHYKLLSGEAPGCAPKVVSSAYTGHIVPVALQPFSAAVFSNQFHFTAFGSLITSSLKTMWWRFYQHKKDPQRRSSVGFKLSCAFWLDQGCFMAASKPCGYFENFILFLFFFCHDRPRQDWSSERKKREGGWCLFKWQKKQIGDVRCWASAPVSKTEPATQQDGGSGERQRRAVEETNCLFLNMNRSLLHSLEGEKKKTSRSAFFPPWIDNLIIPLKAED